MTLFLEMIFIASRLYPSQQVLEGTITDDVENLFTMLWRFHQHRTGPPNDPEITLEAVRSLLTETEPHLFQ